MFDKFLNWISDYQSGRAYFAGFIIGFTWLINFFQVCCVMFDKNEEITKLTLIKFIGIIPPFNILTVWF